MVFEGRQSAVFDVVILRVRVKWQTARSSVSRTRELVPVRNGSQIHISSGSDRCGKPGSSALQVLASAKSELRKQGDHMDSDAQWHSKYSQFRLSQGQAETMRAPYSVLG